jgi:GT2 family glycosyltransferase
MVEVSVLIVNYNTSKEVMRCIRSVYEQTRDVSFEIIIVDNHSSDRSIDDIPSLFPEVHYIRNTENAGFGSACNKAAEQAKGLFLFLLNPDTVLKNNALFLFCRFWKQYEAELAISCLGAPLLNERGEGVHSKGSFPQMRSFLLQKVKSLTDRIRGKRPAGPVACEVATFEAADYITGADLFLSKENFIQVGGFDPRFFMYFEETDLQYRLWKTGKQSYLIGGPLVEHEQYKSFRGNTQLQRILYRDSMLRYFKKHYPGGRFVLFCLSWYLLDFRTLFQKIFISSAPE